MVSPGERTGMFGLQQERKLTLVHAFVFFLPSNFLVIDISRATSHKCGRPGARERERERH